MKKLCLVAFTIICTTNILNAQEVKFGAKAGVNFATVSGTLNGIKSKTSFHFGAMAEFILKDKFSVQPELLFSSQGAKAGNTTLSLSYIQIPILAKYYIIDNLSIEAGPQLGFNLSSKYTVNNRELDIKKQVKSFDLGLNIGAGYKLENGINFSVRYNLGLSNANNTKDGSVTINNVINGEYKNRVLQLSVGYFFL